MTTHAVVKPPQQIRWENNFRVRWGRLSPQEQRRRYGTVDLLEATNKQWWRLQELVLIRSGRRELRAGNARFKSSEIIRGSELLSEERSVLEGLMGGKIT